jgi:UDP-N-acetylmuramoyl-L-alanyl-D-glutamate--2,6-diaminopimelate ligase
MQNYFNAKAKLFDWPGLRHAIINIDDDHGQMLIGKLPDGLRLISTSSCGRSADLTALAIRLGLDGMHFSMAYGGEVAAVDASLLGRFNIDNLLAVAGVLLADGFALAHVADVLGRLTPVGGRMSRLGGVAGVPLVVVDYAHTPDALEQVLNTLRSHSQGKLICVFGCGGDRDRSKRPLMAACAERLADLVWITDDNPRSESGDAIVAEIAAGLKQPAKAYIQRDRRLAIKEALAAACQADIVLIAGKGHETYQEVGGVKTPFDDRAVAAGFLKVAA